MSPDRKKGQPYLPPYTPLANSRTASDLRSDPLSGQPSC